MPLTESSEIKFSLFFLLAFSCCVSNSLRCPKRSSSEKDIYKVNERLNKITSDLSDKNFVSEDHKHTREGSSDTDVYDYTLQLCTTDDKYGAVYQIDKTQNKKTLLGMSNASFALGGTNLILIVFKDGKQYNSFCDKQKREAWLQIVCDKSGKKPQFKVIEESRWKNGSPKKGCYYLFELNHKDACSPEESKGLGGGAIFMIVMVSLFAAYLGFGFLYQRFVRGAKGVEQMPNYTFWRAFGNLTADGCDFVCRRPDHPASHYKGMADALDIDTSDDEKDDHLLPM
ncbi:cation-dependent mannose-6-phosphate receptor-like isoform X2 [Rhopilema esculentum]|uniref:cation-dependent mannose-6-phosphate receptor-like isoform X2 n=1 Tax=Rhopilema esculentum TaxID=499914 RepID=UPI0031E43FF7